MLVQSRSSFFSKNLSSVSSIVMLATVACAFGNQALAVKGASNPEEQQERTSFRSPNPDLESFLSDERSTAVSTSVSSGSVPDLGGSADGRTEDEEFQGFLAGLNLTEEALGDALSLPRHIEESDDEFSYSPSLAAQFLNCDKSPESARAVLTQLQRILKRIDPSDYPAFVQIQKRAGLKLGEATTIEDKRNHIYFSVIAAYMTLTGNKVFCTLSDKKMLVGGEETSEFLQAFTFIRLGFWATLHSTTRASELELDVAMENFFRECVNEVKESPEYMDLATPGMGSLVGALRKAESWVKSIERAGQRQGTLEEEHRERRLRNQLDALRIEGLRLAQAQK